MKVEEALIELGDKRLSSSAYSGVLLTLLSAHLPYHQQVNGEMTGHEILSLIYKLTNHDLQERILGRRIGRVRSTDSYRTAVLVLSAIISIVAMVIAITEIIKLPFYDDSAGILERISTTIEFML